MGNKEEDRPFRRAAITIALLPARRKIIGCGVIIFIFGFFTYSVNNSSHAENFINSISVDTIEETPPHDDNEDQSASNLEVTSEYHDDYDGLYGYDEVLFDEGERVGFRFDNIESRLSDLVDDVNDLRDMLTPEGKALNWIAKEDPRQVESDHPTFVQRYILAVLFFSTNGHDWYQDAHWMTRLHECHWFKKRSVTRLGVVDCSSDGYVTSIDLGSNNLQGRLPSQLGFLQHLAQLNLEENRIKGVIPESFGDLANLRTLSLAVNNLDGTIPDAMGRMNSINEIKLNHNFFTGSMPEDICKLKDGIRLSSLWADCDEDSFPCKCCTECCDGLNICYANFFNN